MERAAGACDGPGAVKGAFAAGTVLAPRGERTHNYFKSLLN